MFKITITNTYNLFKGNNQLGKFKKLSEVIAYSNRFLNGFLSELEIITAVNFMDNTNHNTAEFGASKGMFTVSYRDETIEVE